MWHYQSYNKPITWENYYSQSSYSQRHATITSGIAAATTIVIFFVILLLTFGCRFFSNRRRERSGTNEGIESVGASQHSLDDQRMFVICNCSIPPPLPTYEDALKIVPRPLDIEKEKDASLPPPPKYSLTSEENIYSITPTSTSTINTTANFTTGQEEENQQQNLSSTTS